MDTSENGMFLCMVVFYAGNRVTAFYAGVEAGVAADAGAGSSVDCGDYHSECAGED